MRGYLFEVMLRFDIITLFPEMFAGVLGGSILKRAAEPVPDPSAPEDPRRVREPVASYHLHQLRDFSADARHQKVDKPPFGGGPGMVMQCQPLWDAVKHVEAHESRRTTRRVFVTPTGRPFTQRVAEELAGLFDADGGGRLLLICGHYEGFDQRVLDRLRDEPPNGVADGEPGLDEISVGDFVLSGGELPAMSILDAVVRLLPGALGDADSAKHDSFSPGVSRLLDHPHYTQPATWDGIDVPAVLRSGDHAAIAAWREVQSRERTERCRPDLLTGGTDTSKLPVVVVREADDGDVEGAAAVHREAFGGEYEAGVVRRIHREDAPLASMVAEVDGRIAGHALVTEAALVDQPAVRGLLALGPVSVRPLFHGRGLGSALVRACIAEAKRAGAARLFVWGDPRFYTRFGFVDAEAEGFRRVGGEYPNFLMLNLRPGKAVDGGEIAYVDAFEKG